jgi:transcription termination/antitermination protein NusG
VISEPESVTPQTPSPEGIVPPSAETAPVALPGAPPPPPHEAVEAAHEMTEHATAPDYPANETAPSAVEASQADEPLGEESDLPFAPPLELIDETVADEDLKFDWYILKVQVNREDSIKDALWRRVKMNGLERYFKEIVVPTEDVVEFTKTGKRRVVKRKLYPGYILVNMAVSDESWFVVRETSGIGDFTGSAGKPTPMEPRDVERILRSSKVLPEEEGAGVKTAIPFKTGDRVRVKEGYFQNFEGDVHAIDETHGRVTVMINIFGRATPVEIEHWQIEAV